MGKQTKSLASRERRRGTILFGLAAITVIVFVGLMVLRSWYQDSPGVTARNKADHAQVHNLIAAYVSLVASQNFTEAYARRSDEYRAKINQEGFTIANTQRQNWYQDIISITPTKTCAYGYLSKRSGHSEWSDRRYILYEARVVYADKSVAFMTAEFKHGGDYRYALRGIKVDAVAPRVQGVSEADGIWGNDGYNKDDCRADLELKYTF